MSEHATIAVVADVELRNRIRILALRECRSLSSQCVHLLRRALAAMPPEPPPNPVIEQQLAELLAAKRNFTIPPRPDDSSVADPVEVPQLGAADDGDAVA